MAGFLLVGIALLGWEILARPPQLRRVAYFGLMVFALLMTLSSLGYACLIIMSVVSVIFYGYSVMKRGISPTRFIVGLLLLGSVAGFFTLSKAGLQTVNKVITSTLLEKSNTDSYRDRTQTHDYAIKSMEDTAYIGAGWGSLRASGLAYILLGTLGIPGTGLFLAFYMSLFLPFLHRRSAFRSVAAMRGATTYGDDLYERSLFAATMLMCSMLIAGSEPVSPILWVLFGIATVARPRLPEFLMPPAKSPAIAFEDDTISVSATVTLPIRRNRGIGHLPG